MELFSDLLSWLLTADESLLLLINGWHSPMIDPLMMLISGRWTWLPLYVFLTFCVVKYGTWKRGLFCIILIALTIAASDQVCSSLLRPMVERLRPSNLNNPLSSMVHIVNGYRSGRYGFPSCHAANMFALATFLSLYFRRRMATVTLLLWASVVCYSRLYLGVHYPGDVLCGMIVGSSMAFLFFQVMVVVEQFSKIQKFLKFAFYFSSRKSNMDKQSRI